jgi:hypothetical protein
VIINPPPRMILSSGICRNGQKQMIWDALDDRSIRSLLGHFPSLAQLRDAVPRNQKSSASLSVPVP